mmetsp:Transcript_32771/g.43223  ORF Transcript_32771/g.43223 Transcript_32771/m.43223 type:complete len:156 (+) Transcript_32771:119-586(+)
MTKTVTEISKKLLGYTDGFATLTDAILMLYLLQHNLFSSLNQLNVMAGAEDRPVAAPFPLDSQRSPRSDEEANFLSPSKPIKSVSPRVESPKEHRLSAQKSMGRPQGDPSSPQKLQKNVINIFQNISHTSPDSAYKAKFVKMVRQACLEFNLLPL